MVTELTFKGLFLALAKMELNFCTSPLGLFDCPMSKFWYFPGWDLSSELGMLSWERMLWLLRMYVQWVKCHLLRCFFFHEECFVVCSFRHGISSSAACVWVVENNTWGTYFMPALKITMKLFSMSGTSRDLLMVEAVLSDQPPSASKWSKWHLVWQ